MTKGLRVLRDTDGAPLYTSNSASDSQLVREYMEIRYIKSQNLQDVDFRNMDLRGLSFAGWKLYSCAFNGADISNCSFSRATLVGTWFSGARLENVTFNNATFSGAHFEGTEFVTLREGRRIVPTVRGLVAYPKYAKDERGYEILAVKRGKHWHLLAGCRDFNLRQAKEHWDPETYSERQDEDPKKARKRAKMYQKVIARLEEDIKSRKIL